MQAFDLMGSFWLATDVERKRSVTGRLRHAPGSSVELTVVGRLGDGRLQARRPTIHGELAQPPSGIGPAVSLVRALNTQVTFGVGPALERYVADTVHMGDGWVEGEDTPFARLDVRLRDFPTWLGHGGLSLEFPGPGEMTVRVARDRDVRLELDGATISIVSKVDATRETGRVAVSEDVHLRIAPDAPLPWREIDRELVSPLRDLTSLATGRSERVTSTRCVVESEEGRAVGTDIVLESAPPEEKRLNPYDVYFRVKPASFGEVFGRFLQIHRKRRAFVRLFFSLLDAPPTFVEMRLILLIEALTLWVGGDLEEGLQWLRESSLTAHCVGDTPAPWVDALSTARRGLWTETQRSTSFHAARLEGVLRLALLRELEVDEAAYAQHRHLEWLRSMPLA